MGHELGPINRHSVISNFIKIVAENTTGIPEWETERIKHNQLTGEEITRPELERVAYQMAEESLFQGDGKGHATFETRVSHPIYSAFNLPQSTETA